MNISPFFCLFLYLHSILVIYICVSVPTFSYTTYIHNIKGTTISNIQTLCLMYTHYRDIRSALLSKPFILSVYLYMYIYYGYKYIYK